MEVTGKSQPPAARPTCRLIAKCVSEVVTTNKHRIKKVPDTVLLTTEVLRFKEHLVCHLNRDLGEGGINANEYDFILEACTTCVITQ